MKKIFLLNILFSNLFLAQSNDHLNPFIIDKFTTTELYDYSIKEKLKYIKCSTIDNCLDSENSIIQILPNLQDKDDIIIQGAYLDENIKVYEINEFKINRVVISDNVQLIFYNNVLKSINLKNPQCSLLNKLFTSLGKSNGNFSQNKFDTKYWDKGKITYSYIYHQDECAKDDEKSFTIRDYKTMELLDAKNKVQILEL